MALPQMGEGQLVTVARLGVGSEPAQEDVSHSCDALVSQFSGTGAGGVLIGSI